MRQVPRPLFSAQEVLSRCIASVQDIGLKSRLKLSGPTIGVAESEYVRHGEQGSLHHIAATNGVGSFVSSDEMERLYNGTFVKSTRTRDKYDELKKACVKETLHNPHHRVFHVSS